jgi:hypothetical protein
VKLPGGETAIVERQKLTEYCLAPDHPRGKHKARVFAVLGFTVDNADELRVALLNAAATMAAEAGISDGFGDRYVLEFEIEGPRRSGTIRSTWIVRRGETTPRLTSCFVK